MWIILQHTITHTHVPFFLFLHFSCLLHWLSYKMKFIILLLSIITIIEAAPPPAPQYEGQSVGAMPCYLGCCKLIHILFLIYFFISIYTPIYMNINFDFIMCIRVFTLGTPCERINCINGGYCIQPATPTSLAYCHCPPQYTGYRCEQPGKK